MAMRGALTHRKTRRLAKLMAVPLPCALGLMEALWHVTAEQAPTGAIGRLSNQDIADEMFWDGDADTLIQSFIDAGLLNVHEQFRLVVHNYHKYADQATKRKVARHGLEFAVIDEQCLVMASQELDVTGLPVPVPVPVPETSTRDQSPAPEPEVAPLAFARPQMAEAVAYAVKLGMPEREGSAYMDYHTSKGWKVGKEPMKDWKAAMRTWNRNWRERQPRSAPGSGPPPITPEQARAMLTGEGLEDKGSPLQANRNSGGMG